jgi:hypothetical protein
VLANDPRPLRQAVAALCYEYGWAIDFEDPQYTSSFDLVDDTDPGWRSSHPEAKPVFVPAGHAFQVDFAPSVGPEMVLRKLVDEYNRTDNPGRFEVVREDDHRVAIVGRSRRNDKGDFQPSSSILDTVVTVPAQTRTGLEMLELLVHELSEATGINVKLGWTPVEKLASAKVTASGTNVSARELLTSTLSMSSGDVDILVWSVLFDPDSGGYYLSVHDYPAVHFPSPFTLP